MKNKKIKALFIAIAVGVTSIASYSAAWSCSCDDLSFFHDAKPMRQCYVGLAKSDDPEERFCGYNGFGDLFSGARSRLANMPEKDFPKALKCYKRAYDAAIEAYQKNKNFMYEVYDSALKVGELYYFGETGIPSDKKEAFAWLQKALPFAKSDKRNADISTTSSRLYCYLGESYLKGFGTTKNGEKALDYLKRSGLRSNRVAIYLMGTMYEDGVFVKKDLKKALEFYSSSYNKGFKKAEEPMKRITKKFEDDLNLDSMPFP